jgi:hypothetical protein
VVLLGDACHSILVNFESYTYEIILIRIYIAIRWAGCCHGGKWQPDGPSFLADILLQIEDGAVLGNLLSRITSSEQVPSVVLTYESLRKGRCSRAHADARRNGVLFHLPDGPEQESRDRELRQILLRHDMSDAEATERNRWAEKMKNRDQFGYDADEEVERWWKENRG